MKTVVVAFSDKTLGGTSRSALHAGMAWAAAGWSVYFIGLRGIHPDRLQSFQAAGQLIDPRADSIGFAADIVHFHHSAWSREMRLETTQLLQLLFRDGTGLVLTNNIFAVDDRWLRRLCPYPILTGVLSEWCAWQYLLNSGRVSSRNIAVIPNAQSVAHRRVDRPQARRELMRQYGIPIDMPMVLRAGSPLMGKWSKTYERAIVELDRYVWVLVGAPRSLENSVSSLDNAFAIDRLSNDNDLRILYGAANVFAHDARRGESFGNVLLESLSAGTPVVYRERPLRDNTPSEFVRVQGFFSALTYRSWRSAISEVIDASPVVDSPDEYSIESVSRQLDSIAKGAGSRHIRVPIWPGVIIGLLHNPLVSVVKGARLAWRSRDSMWSAR